MATGRRMILLRSRLTLITPLIAALLMAGCAVTVLAAAAPLPASAAEPAPATARTLTGKVVMMSSNVCVIKDASGTSVMLNVRQQTRLEGEVREGATVEATVSPDGTATLIKAIK